MDIREIISFYYTAQFGSVSRAAVHLHIGQPTVTAHLQRLEKQLGVQLFDRLRRPIRLTAEGATILESATPVVQQLEQGLDSLRARWGFLEQEGSLTIGTYPELAMKYLPQAIEEFKQQYPKIQISVITQSYAAMMELIGAADIDLALAHAPPEEGRGIEFRKLFDSNFVLIAPCNHQLLLEGQATLQSLAQWPLILQSRRSYARPHLEQALRETGLEYHIALEMVDHAELVKQFVKLGMGIGIVAEFSLDSGQEEGLGLLNLSTLIPPVPVGISTLSSEFLPAPTQYFIDVLMKRQSSQIA